MRVTKMTVLCALHVASVSAFVGPMAPSPAVRVAKRPVLTMGPGLKLAPGLAVRPRPGRRAATKVQALALDSPPEEPLSVDDKRMFVRWSYVMCLFNRYLKHHVDMFHPV